MSKFIEFTEEEIYRAAHTEIKSVLESKGEAVLPSGSEWLWKEHDSVKIRGNVFFQHSTGDHGTAIDFLCLFYNMRFQDAVMTLIGREYNGVELARSPQKVKKKSAPFSLPPRNRNMHRVYAYLMEERKIHSEIISFFAHNRTLYESADRHNAVFVGLDSGGNPRAAHLKGTLSAHPYRQDVPGGSKEYFFNYAGGSNRLYLFEAPIDLLSFLSIYRAGNWQQHNFLALGGVSALPMLRFLLEYPQITEVAPCLDNDVAGREAVGRIVRILEKLKEGKPVPELGKLEPPDPNAGQTLIRDYQINTSVVSTAKDWNEDLVEKRETDDR